MNNKVYYMNNETNRIHSGYKIGKLKAQQSSVVIEEIKTYGGKRFYSDLVVKNKSEIYDKEQVIDKIKEILKQEDGKILEIENKYKESIQKLEKEKLELNNYKMDKVDKAFSSFKFKMEDVSSFEETEELLKLYRDVKVGYNRKVRVVEKKFIQLKKQYEFDNKILSDVMQHLKNTLNEINKENE